MPIYNYTCESCGREEDNLMTYEERLTEFDCECGEKMVYEISAVTFVPGGGGHPRRAIAPDVGPNSKTSKAYQKKMDDQHSRYYAPGMSQSMTSKQRTKFNATQADMKKGKTDFTNK